MIESRTKHIHDLEMRLMKTRIDQELKAVKKQQEEQYINFLTSFTVARANLEIAAMFGLIKLDNQK